MDEQERQDWQFDFVLEGATEIQADSLLSVILKFVRLDNLTLGGGYHPLESEPEVANGPTEDCDEVQEA